MRPYVFRSASLTGQEIRARNALRCASPIFLVRIAAQRSGSADRAWRGRGASA
jgi:hypothetical protein